MESRGVTDLYLSLVEKNNLRYRPFIGDGDSSSYSAVSKRMPYGGGFPIDKWECVNHYGKRPGKRLREFVRQMKGQ